MQALPLDTSQIVITASREPVSASDTPASVSVIDNQEIQRLGEPIIASLLRLTPSASVTTVGPAGSLTELRIRGSEANHSLLFVDGIKINDPAAGDTPRFELLNADLASRVEVVRGPQSALWGSDAIGGVIAVNGLDDPTGQTASAEAGSFGLFRASASAGVKDGRSSLSGAVGFQRATGIDSFGAPGGDKDGYRNLSGRLRGTYQLSPFVRVGASALALKGTSEFDGYDTVTFEHADTADETRNKLLAGRVWADFGREGSAWDGRISGSLLGSSNRNYLASDLLNTTSGRRRVIDAQVGRQFRTGAFTHHLIVAAEAEHETFKARDTVYGGFTDQDRTRDHKALTAEWRAHSSLLTADVAVRRDMFNRFKDATSLRASLLGNISQHVAITGSFAQGIAQPTFFDLYGFFPGNFVGNRDLKPESSRGFEAGVRYAAGPFSASVTGYRQRLRNEIVDVVDYTLGTQTTANRDAVSRRSGLEVEAGWRLSNEFRLSGNYAYLRATEPDSITDRQSPELRRPKHSGAVQADGQIDKFSYGASVAFVGKRLDRSDNYPYGIVGLHSYWLADARVGYAILPQVQVFARATNLFNARYEDSAGYRTEGRGVFAGVRLSR